MPHHALRTPGYPLFLAACQALFGERFLPVRLVQAALGTLGVYFVYRLVERAIPGRNVAIVAALLAAVEPYGIGLGELILSEGLFIPLMLAGLWGLAVLLAEGVSGKAWTCDMVRPWRSGRASSTARRSWSGRRGR